MGCSSGAELETDAEVECEDDGLVLLGGALALGCVRPPDLVGVTVAALGSTGGGDAGC